jgi:hypothetical protein
VGHSLGTDGRTLFARVKTKYVPEKEVGDPLRERTVLPKVDVDAPFYQYEMWTHLDGAWGVARTPGELIQAKRKDLIAGMATIGTPLGPVPVISSGTRLWYAIDWKVHTLDADGVVHSADLPKPAVKESETPRQKFAPPLMLAAFAKLDDKSFVLAVAGPETKTYKVHFWGGKPMGVRVEELAPLPLPFAVVHRAADGTVMAWADNHARGYPLLPDGQPPAAKGDLRALYRLRDGKWEAVANAAQPLGIAPDGTLWCPPYQPHDDTDARIGKAVLHRVSGEKAERFVWERDEWQIGFSKPSPGSTVLVLPLVGLGCVEPAKDGAKPTLRVRYVGPLTQLEQRRPVVTASGHLLLPTEWGRLFDPPAK